jgi:hypothetical protein
MKNEWIIEVLRDLRSFASENDLPRLADQLDEALVVATVELVQHLPTTGTGRHDTEAGHLAGWAR